MVKRKVFEVNIKQATVLQLKQLINHQFGILAMYQNMFDYPELPDPVPGLRLFADNHIFDEKIEKIPQTHLVLTVGEFVHSWAYVYVHYPCGNGRMKVARIKFHRFSTIAYVKRLISMAISLQASDIQLCHKANGHPFNDNSNVY